MNMFKSNGGFTLVELIVVIAILAILAGVAVPAYSGYINSANQAADITALAAVKTAVMATYATEGSVTAIKYTETDNKLQAKVGDAEAYADVETGADSDFYSYYGGALSLDLQTGDTAEWNGTEWNITTASGNNG